MPRYYALIDGKELGFEVLPAEQGTVVRPIGEQQRQETHVDFAAVHASVDTGEGLYSILADGKSYQLYVEPLDNGYRMIIWRHRFDVQVLTEREFRLQKVAPKQAGAAGTLVVNAPMPGLVKSVMVAEGEQVASGQRLVVLEAMKMENDINAPREGRIAKLHVAAGTVVEGGKPLVTLE